MVSAGAASGAAGMTAQTARLETFTQWMSASRQARAAALEATLSHIKSTDSSIHAWVQVLPQRPTGDGPLAEIPFGAKDIMETRGLSTEYGSPIYKGRVGTEDAAIVRDLRQRGAVLLGKTHTTSFAYRTPAPTRNPLNLAHTPGGSSSGSAAAVAAGMVPFALGTQTMGSVLRPASYCGVTGFKASYGVLSLDGVLPSMAAAFQSAVATLRRGGVSIRSIDIAGMLTELHPAALDVEFYEGARFHEQRFKEYGERLEHLGALVREGLQIPVERYDEARRRIAAWKTKIAEVYKSTPVILVPAATGPAPEGLALTGDARMNSPWTALGTPAITIPMSVAGALPLGLQLTAEHGQDARVIRTAVRAYRILSGERG